MEKEGKKNRKKKIITQRENDVAFASDDKILDMKTPTVEPKFVGVKDNYLPHVLVKLGICSNNGDARRYIRTKGVLLNGVPTNSCDAISEGLKIEQFELAVEGGLYHIFLI